VKIPLPIVIVFLGVWLSVQGWTVRSVVDLKVKVSALDQQLQDAVHHVQFGQASPSNCGVQVALGPRSAPISEKTPQEAILHGSQLLVSNPNQK